MGAITGYLSKATEFAGDYKIVNVTALLTSASDTITLTEASHGISEIDSIIGCLIMSGMDTALTTAQASYSGLVITVVTKGQDGNASTSWDNGTISVTVLGK